MLLLAGLALRGPVGLDQLFAARAYAVLCFGLGLLEADGAAVAACGDVGEHRVVCRFRAVFGFGAGLRGHDGFLSVSGVRPCCWRQRAQA